MGVKEDLMLVWDNVGMVINTPLLYLEGEAEYRSYFEQNLAQATLSLEGFKVVINREDFDHVCYEMGKGGVQKSIFGVRRARKMLLIKDICSGLIPYQLLWQGHRSNQSICVLSREAEFAFYLLPIPSQPKPYLKLLTMIAFGDGVEKRIHRQTSQALSIKRIEEGIVKFIDSGSSTSKLAEQ